ncbi:MAG TPA: nitrilase-related carbon-nitrogen hydrolase [Clostridia bacterium]|nr:nitrilase-related carbon-nitrogen hydrolase [Clostridia bacterium]
MMGRKIKVALGQFASGLGAVEYNVGKAGQFIARASEKGADIICLPELFATGYNLSILGEKAVTLSREYAGFIREEMSKGARANNIYVIASYGEVDESDSKVYNAAVLYDRKGKKAGSYYKTHAFALERNYFAAGGQYPVFDTDIGKLGILICYDAGFPEAARTLCLKGAEIIFIPAAWRIEDENAWMLNVPSRALENQLYTVGVNRTGCEGELHLFGKSMVCDPYGRSILQMDYDSEDIALCEIDLEEVERCRLGWGYLKDRRPGIYQL